MNNFQKSQQLLTSALELAQKGAVDVLLQLTLPLTHTSLPLENPGNSHPYTSPPF